MTLPLILVAVDGFDISLLERILALGNLPTLARLKREGVLGALRGPVHPSEAAVWASFLTGTDAGRNGISDGIQRQPGTYKFSPATSRHLRTSTFWRVAASRGHRVGILNAPLHYPPRSVAGYLVAGNDSPSYNSPFTYPNGIAPLLAQGLGGTYQFDREVPLDTLEESIVFAARLLQARIDSYFTLEKKFKHLNLRLVAFSIVGRLLSHFWSEIERVILSSTVTTMPAWGSRFLDLFHQLDTFVGDVLKQMNGQVNLVLCSTWSVGQLWGTFSMNGWLLENGHLVLHPGFTIEDFPEGVDWSRTLAYAPGPWGSIYLNLRGREPNGIIEPGSEAAVIRRQLSHKLRSVRHEAAPLVTALYTNEEAYNGPFWPEAPDLNVVLRDYSFLAGPWLGSGSSRPRGFALFHGPDVTHRVLPDHPIEDLAPTILHLLDLPIPDKMKGKSFGSHIADLVNPKIDTASAPECMSINCLYARIDELKRKNIQFQALAEASQANEMRTREQMEEVRQELLGIIQQFQAGRVMRLLTWLTLWKRNIQRRVLGKA